MRGRRVQLQVMQLESLPSRWIATVQVVTAGSASCLQIGGHHVPFREHFQTVAVSKRFSVRIPGPGRWAARTGICTLRASRGSLGDTLARRTRNREKKNEVFKTLCLGLKYQLLVASSSDMAIVNIAVSILFQAERKESSGTQKKICS